MAIKEITVPIATVCRQVCSNSFGVITCMSVIGEVITVVDSAKILFQSYNYALFFQLKIKF
jgi:hypothetical protein